MKKKRLFLIVGILVGISYIIVSAAINNAHSLDKISISVGGESMTLQDAISSGALIGEAATSVPFSFTTGHKSSEIWVSVDGSENTLANFASIPNGLCGSITTLSYSNYNLNPGHTAMELNYAASTTLQQAIDAGVFCASECVVTTSCTWEKDPSSVECSYLWELYEMFDSEVVFDVSGLDCTGQSTTAYQLQGNCQGGYPGEYFIPEGPDEYYVNSYTCTCVETSQGC